MAPAGVTAVAEFMSSISMAAARLPATSQPSKSGPSSIRRPRAPFCQPGPRPLATGRKRDDAHPITCESSSPASNQPSPRNPGQDRAATTSRIKHASAAQHDDNGVDNDAQAPAAPAGRREINFSVGLLVVGAAIGVAIPAQVKADNSEALEAAKSALYDAFDAIPPVESNEEAATESTVEGNEIETPPEGAPTTTAPSEESNSSGSGTKDSLAVTSKVFLEFTVDGKPAGRVVIGLFGIASPIGAQRFEDLAVGIEGVSYRRSLLDKVDPSYIRDIGVRSFSYAADSSDVGITGGPSARKVAEELDLPNRPLHDQPFIVSLVVRLPDDSSDDTKQRLIAKDGKLVVVDESVGPPKPNGSAFVITTQPVPELDFTNVVVGKVLEGQEVVTAFSKIPSVRDNRESGYFKTAKAIGDVRATVAEAGFGKPFARVQITKSGKLDG